jgi:iron complex outermembrane receptor protein
MKVTVLLCFFCFGLAYTQNDHTNQLDEIVLRGNFSSLVNSGYQVNVISDSILSENFEALGSLLQKQSNFYFKQNGNGMVSSISLRGTSASQTGVYWNGIAINSALNGQTDFNSLQASGFDEVEIRKGGGSALLGSGAIGGAVNLKDKVAFSSQRKLMMSLGAGSFNTYYGHLKALFSTEKLFFKIAGGAMNSKNDYPISGTDLKNDNGAFRNYNFSSTLAYRLNESHTISLNTVIFDNDRNLSGTLSSESRAKLYNRDQRLLIDWKYLGNRYTSSLKAAFLYEDFTYLFDKNVKDQESYGKSNRFIGKYDFSYFLKHEMFVKAGMEFENAKGNGSSLSNAEQTDFTAYLLFHQQPWQGFAYNISLRAGVSSVYDIPFIYSVDGKYALNRFLTLRAAFSTNYRLPTFNDLYWEPGGNPDLKPEKSLSTEMGLELSQDNFKLGGTFFMIKSEDLILWRPVGNDFWQAQNISEASNYGLEFTAEAHQSFDAHNFKLKLQYDYTRALDDKTQNQLIYVPEHKANSILDYSWKKWNFTYNLQYVGEVFITTSNSQSLDDYWLSDVSFSKSFLQNRLQLGIHIKNLFEENYQSVAYRPMPGRNFLVHINFKI